MSPAQQPEPLPAFLLDRDDFTAACAAHDFAEVFRLVQKYTGYTNSRIGRLTEMSPSRIGDILSGRINVRSSAVIERIADGLRVPGTLLGLAARSWEAPHRQLPKAEQTVQRRRQSGASRPPALPLASVPGQHRHMAAMDSFRMADRQLGGGHLYNAVIHYLNNVVAPGLFGTEQTSGALRAAAALTEMAGWMAHDSGQDVRARSHFEKALPLAQAGTDPMLAAHIMASMSHLAVQTDQPDEAITLARAGQDQVKQGPRVPMLSARLHAMEARALARIGEVSASRRAIDAAELWLTREADEAPSAWISPFDAAALASEAAISLQDVRHLTEAAAAAERAVALRAKDRARSRVFGQISLAMIRTDMGDVDAACAIGFELLESCSTLGSVRITQQLDDLSTALQACRDQPAVADFLGRLEAVNQERTLLLAGINAPQSEGVST